MQTIVLIGTIASSVYGFRSELIQALVARGYTVYAFAVDYNADSRLKVQALGAIPVDYQLDRGGLNPLAEILTIYKLCQKIKSIGPDMVLSYFVKPVIYGTFAAAYARVPYRVAMLEGLGYAFTGQPEGISLKASLIQTVQINLYRIVFRYLHRVVFLNQDDVVDLVDRYRLPAAKVDVLGGIGLDLAQYPYTPLEPQPCTFIFVGRLLKEKGIHEYLKAARIVKDRYPEVSFVVLGQLDPHHPGALSEQELAEMVEQGTVIYPGQVDNVSAWLTRASVFVLPSYREGFPRSTQEAMAIGRAVITTDVPGCRQTVQDGVNGFLVPPWSVAALMDKMVYCVEHPAEVRRMGDASYEIARREFDAHVVNDKLLAMIGI